MHQRFPAQSPSLVDRTREDGGQRDPLCGKGSLWVQQDSPGPWELDKTGSPGRNAQGPSTITRTTRCPGITSARQAYLETRKCPFLGKTQST